MIPTFKITFPYYIPMNNIRIMMYINQGSLELLQAQLEKEGAFIMDGLLGTVRISCHLSISEHNFSTLTN